MFFRKKKTPEVSHLCFMTRAAKNRFIPQLIDQSPQKVWLICFFEKTYADVKSILARSGHLYQEGRDRGEETVICLVDRLSIDNMEQALVVLVEDHPLFSESEKLQKILFNREVKELKILVALDEPMMKSFDESGRLQKMMTQLGMKADEVIEHRMVSKAIERAQKKLEESLATTCLIWSSQEEWFEDNQYNYK